MKKYTAKDLAAAQEAERLARGKRMEIEEAIQEREYAPLRRALVGKCFKYRNSYSCPEKPSDYWWLWIRVTGIDGYSLTTSEVQKDKHGAITIKSSNRYAAKGVIDDAYIPVTTGEYRRAVNAILKLAASIV